MTINFWLISLKGCLSVMRRICLLTGLILVTIAVASDGAFSDSRPRDGDLVNLFFAGRRQSSMEPCGCHSKQQGGIQYEATILNTHRAESPVLALDAGEWADMRLEENPFQVMKTRYLLQGLGALVKAVKGTVKGTVPFLVPFLCPSRL